MKTLESETANNLDNKNICNICETQEAKYICPKCNILYCSLSCYRTQKHSQCSETFYQNCIQEEMGLQTPNNRQIQDISRMLKGVNNDFAMNDIDSDDNEVEPDLAERLKGVDLNDANNVWTHLTPDEQQEFEALVSSGDITECMPAFEPWWKQTVERKIQEIGIDEEVDFNTLCPSVAEEIKPFHLLTKNKPSACVKYNILNVLAAYTFTVRYFHGDHFDYSKEAVYVLTNLSRNILLNANFESYTMAVESVHQQSLQNDWVFASANTAETIRDDVAIILKKSNRNNNSHFLLCALSDIYNLLILSKKQKVTQDKFSVRFMENMIPSDKLISKQNLLKCIRKIEFYLSYVYTFASHVMMP